MANMPKTHSPLGHKMGRAGRREYDRQRSQLRPWRRWYNTKVWRAIRRVQLAKEPNCERCEAKGKTVAATVVNHRERHGGDWDKFVSGPFESACKPCHDSDIQREELEEIRAKSLEMG